MRVALCLALLSCATVAVAWSPLQAGWQLTGKADPATPAHLTVGLKLPRVDALKRFVAKVSDPSNPLYGQYLSLEQLTAMYSPTPATVAAVQAFFLSAGATVEVSASKDALWVTLPVAKLAAITGGARFATYTHPVSKRTVVRTEDAVVWAWPPSVAAAVELVTGVQDFLDTPLERKGLKALRAASRAASAASSAPEVLRCQGSEGLMVVEALPYCQDGKPATLPSGMCDDGSTVVSMTLTASPRGGATITKEFSLPSMLVGGQVPTTAPVSIPAFARVNITMTTKFSDGSTSPAGSLPNLWSPSPWVDPRTIHAQYGIPVGLRGTHPNNSQAVGSFEAQYFSPTDLNAFYDEMGLPRYNPVVKGFNNDTQAAAGGEATLDISYITGVGAGIPTTFWSVNGDGPAHGAAYILAWAYLVGNTTDAPLVTSLSYGDTETGYFNKFGSFSYIDRMNTELAKMAARGLTVLAGSGDAGCTNVGEAGNDISGTDPDCSRMRPFFPSNSPYVTSVSATFFTANALPVCDTAVTGSDIPVVCTQVGERAVSVTDGIRWTTGGGFSNYTAVQPWQAGAVSGFLKDHASELPPASFFNASGRGYPDVAVIGHNLLMQWGGRRTPVDGTSASGPVMAGILGLVNDARLHANMPPLGLVNPLLYKAAAAQPATFTDVVTGQNADGDFQARGSPFPTFCPAGFKTAAGWDAVTGLGSPYWPSLLAAALNPSHLA